MTGINGNRATDSTVTTDISIPREHPGLRRRCWWIFIITIVIYILPAPFSPGYFLLTKTTADSWNDEARIATVESLAERGTLAIEHSKWGWFTGDKVLLREHFYSTKPPLLSAVGAVSYMALRGIVRLGTGQEISYLHNEDIIYPWVTLTTSVLAFALLLVYFYRALHLVEIDPRGRWWLFGALAVGSLYPAYSTVLNNHTVAGAGIFIAFFYILKYRLGGRLRWWEVLLSGLSIGFAGVTDFTGALPFAAFFFILLAVHDWIRAGLWPVKIPQAGAAMTGLILTAAVAFIGLLSIGTRGVAILLFTPLIIGILISLGLAFKGRPATLLYLLGVMIPVLAHLFLNSRITGNWMPTYVQSDVYIAVPPGYFGEVLSPEEAGAMYWTRWKYVGTALFGIRGVFLYTPVLLMGFVYAVMAAFRRGSSLRLEAASVILAVLAGWGWVLFFASPNFGGTSYGFRYALAASPMLIFFCYPIFTAKVKPVLQVIFRNAVAWGTIVGLIAITHPWGIGGQLPATQCSIIENLEYNALNTLLIISRVIGG